MRIGAPIVSRPSARPGRVRISADIRYRSLLAGTETVWFELDESFESQLSDRGSPWLVAMLPLGFVTGDPIELDAPVDPELPESCRKLMAIWAGWYPKFSPVDIHAHALSSPPAREPGLTGCLFSGGVDSFYTLFHDREVTGGSIDELVTVQGADIPLRSERAFERAMSRIHKAARYFDLPVRIITTNLRTTRFDLANWTLLSSGCLLAAAGLILEPRYTHLLMSSTWPAENLRPLGTHPATDPLLSTSRTRIVHYGDWIERSEKVAYLCEHQVVLDNLRVCWESGTGTNCGRCAKCLRTMAVLEVLGRLEAASCFEARHLDLNVLARQYLGRDRAYFREVRAFARRHGREDVAGAIKVALTRTERLNRFPFGMVVRLREWARLQPAIRAFARGPLRQLRRAARVVNNRLR